MGCLSRLEAALGVRASRSTWRRFSSSCNNGQELLESPRARRRGRLGVEELVRVGRLGGVLVAV
ncbi:MAG TPA: hypothetical protein ACN46U_05160 [Prochlorococcus sp.]